MSTGLMRLLLCVFFYTVVSSTMLDPSPTANFRKYTSDIFICTAETDWTSVSISLKYNKTVIGDNLGFFLRSDKPCTNKATPNTQYQFDCNENTRKFTMTIRNVTDTINGKVLECADLERKVYSTINVQYPPTADPSIIQMPPGNVVAGRKVFLTCEISGGNPLANISWICSGFTTVATTTAPSASKVISVVERTVTREDDNKECTCVGKHLFWTAESKHNLTVYYRPTVTVLSAHDAYDLVEHTTNFNLTCNVIAANPDAVTYKWYRQDSDISNGSTLIIPTVQKSNAGSYTCKAENIAGVSNHSSAVELNVLYGIEMNPIKRHEPAEGDSITITCSGKSNPELTDNDVTWTKQNNESFIEKGQRLVLNNVNRIDSGIYVCSVVIQLKPTIGQPVNVNGTTNVFVDVLYQPTVTISLVSSPYKVVENITDFNFTCLVIASNPGVTSYVWYKDGSNISTDATYTISSIQRNHTGSYTCAARNKVDISSNSSAVKLDVLYGVDLKPIGKHTPVEGTELNITCVGRSNPAIEDNDIKWTKHNNTKFKKTGRFLVKDNVNRTDSGTYVCSVMVQLKPTVGSSVNVSGTTTVDVDVLYKPTVRVFSAFNPNFVTENTTDLIMLCNVTDANPPAKNYSWKKDDLLKQSTATYTISTVKRSDAGSYTCSAINDVGSSDASPVFQLNVLYGVSLKLSDTKISLNESERWDLSCIGDGNPSPIIHCVNEYNNSIVGQKNVNATSISIKHANCIDTGIYICIGNNTVGKPVSKSANISVACKPRTSKYMKTENIFINGTDESLNISTTFISFPLSIMSWSRKLPNGNSTELDSAFSTSVIQSNLPYEQTSLLLKDRLESDEFGIYLLKASNVYGSFLLTYNVISKRKPDPPTFINASCEITSIRVSWISRFNGGENQTFRIYFVKYKSNQTTIKDGIADDGRDKMMSDEKEYLSPDTLYKISLEAYNFYGRATSTETLNCTTYIDQIENQPESSALVGGIAGSLSALVIVAIVIGVIYFWRRRQVSGGHKKLLKRHSKETDEDEEGLKTNPLYVTSGEVSNAEVGPVYGVVNKKRQEKEMTLDENNDQGPVYSQVQKPKTQEKKKGKDKKAKTASRNVNNKDIELGTVYENSDKLSKLHSSDELYANAGEQKKGVNFAKGYIPKKNKDGLIYADLDLVPGPNGKKFVIRGIENKTNYAMIDLSIKVDPLPSDDDDEQDKDSENAKSAANECNE